MVYLSFTWNFGILWSFLMGVFFGAVILSLIYCYFCLLSLKKNSKKVSKTVDIPEEAALKYIQEAQEKFKDKDLRGNTNIYKHLGSVCVDLITDIATLFFPDSKYPMYELSIEESLELAKYISDRVNELLDHKGLRQIKKLTISRILGWIDVKKKADQNKMIQASVQVNKVWGVVKKVLNYANPIFWARKLVISKSIEYVMKKICLVVISIVGEETYKVYSKKAFQQELTLDSGTESLVKDMNESIDALSNEELEQLNHINLEEGVEQHENIPKEKNRRRKA